MIENGLVWFFIIILGFTSYGRNFNLHGNYKVSDLVNLFVKDLPGLSSESDLMCGS